MEKFKIPTDEEIKNIFILSDDKGNQMVKGTSIPLDKTSFELICHMKGAFKCERCGKCCKFCSPIIIQRQEFNNICKYLNISHSEFKKRYSPKIKKDVVYIIDGCPFFDEEKKECSIYEIRPLICKQFPFTGALIKPNEVEKKIDIIPTVHCSPFLKILYFSFGLPPEVRETIELFMKICPKEELDIFRNRFIEKGFNRLKEEEEDSFLK